jgi:hypothetical protein
LPPATISRRRPARRPDDVDLLDGAAADQRADVGGGIQAVADLHRAIRA